MRRFQAQILRAALVVGLADLFLFAIAYSPKHSETHRTTAAAVAPAEKPQLVILAVDDDDKLRANCQQARIKARMAGDRHRPDACRIEPT